MYEAEANCQVGELSEIPEAIIENFRESRRSIEAKTIFPWGEHCTECVWPTCYNTCDLFSPRSDGRCKRFIDGMVRLDLPDAINLYLLKIRFKSWGKLWANGNMHLFPLGKANQIERLDQLVGSILNHRLLPFSIRKYAIGKRYVWKKRLALARRPSSNSPNLFLIECYNPGKQIVNMSLTIRSAENNHNFPYQRLIKMLPGYNREEIPVEEITRVFDLHLPFSVDLIPNDIIDDTLLYFGAIDFVKTKQVAAQKVNKQQSIKCIVWDLDNTLWDGILVEDGADRLTLKPGIVDIIKDLDRRGILHSIASKNNPDEAMAVLQNFSLEEYFLYPQISWAPKSEAMKEIAQKINIGMDTLMLIDDSDFELAQVQSACPEAKTYRADRYQELLDLPECQVPITEESTNRRKMYQQEAVRESVAVSHKGDYLSFLRDCRIEVQLESLSLKNLERVHELTQRTNQMNFSGNRYDRNLLKQIVATQHLHTYVISCRDRFGSYGIVGFSIVDSREPRMTDLMFSCRIQSKRVEHAFLSFLLKKYILPVQSDFWVNYRKTPRNAPSGKVFDDIGMKEIEEHDGVTSLVFRKEEAIPDDSIISIVEI